MKLRRLKLKNLNSFRDEVDIDFEKPPLDDASLVAITGPTGAGKTTLLDAICVALYGKTPRLTGRDTRNPKHLISHGENEAFAEVYFEANSKRYHVTWTIKRNYSPRTQLFDSSGTLITTDVSQEIESILGLDFDAFKRSVMLAQGEFAAFLRAKDEERRTILEAAASVDIYDELKRTLNDKVAAVETEYQNVLQKLEAVPEVSLEQLSEAETELARLQAEAEKLDGENQQIQTEKEHETKRKEDYEKLQSSEENEKELINQQPVIDKLKSELEDAERANQLRAEKQVYDTAKLDKENATASLQKAETELADARKQVEINQTDYNQKDTTYLSASTERDRKMEVYADAKSEVARAAERFSEVNKRTPTLEDLNEKIEKTSSQLSDRQAEQVELQEQITAAETFLNENLLPSDRNQRIIRVSELLTELWSKRKQLKDKSNTQSGYLSKIDDLNENLREISDNREKLQSEVKTAVNSLKQAETELRILQNTGGLEEWQNRKEIAIKAQLIAQQYENSGSQLSGKESIVEKLQKNIIALNTSLDDLEKKLTVQSQHCEHADAEVNKLEKEKELALLADSTNQLRQQLEAGKPCRVCGATDHPYADKVEVSEEQLKCIQQALNEVEMEAQKAHAQKRELEQGQVRLQQDKANTTEQLETGLQEIESINTETENLCLQWQKLYESKAISSDWVEKRIKEADAAIENFNAIRNNHKDTSNALQLISQKLKTCELNFDRESELLDDTQQELDTVNEEVEDLKSDISAIEKRFWESMPDVFHGIMPDKAVKQFESKIEEVEDYQDELRDAETNLQLLNANIETDWNDLKDLGKRLKDLQDEIQNYQNEGEKFLVAVREKTDGLDTEDEINTAISNLEAELQMKEKDRDAARQILQENEQLSAQKLTAHEICEKQHRESGGKFEISRNTYYEKLKEVGLDSPEVHDEAFREETQIQALTQKIDTHESEKQQLEVEIVALRTRFETPYNPEILKRIKSQAEEIAAETQNAQEEIGRQNEKIDNLKDNFKKREELDSEVHTAQQERERWKKLQEIIPRNELRDFALDIMFQQVSRIANVQLAYLTSERYQLGVETIGKLTVIDRWNANEKRPVETLSGGESFLTSLALALALSELSQGRAQLNSLFLDEGFGTLDAETLDIAIAALEGLQMQGRSIYLISHIQELTRRLPVKIKVKKRGDGSSYIDTN